MKDVLKIVEWAIGEGYDLTIAKRIEGDETGATVVPVEVEIPAGKYSLLTSQAEEALELRVPGCITFTEEVEYFGNENIVTAIRCYIPI